MVLTMSRPFKHPKTGVYYFRKAVPADLRALRGRVEEKVSLGTKDPAEARDAHARVAAEIANTWKALRSAPAPLTHRQIMALAGELYRDYLALAPDEPGPPEVWEAYISWQERIRAAGGMAASLKGEIDDLLHKRGIRADEESRRRLVEELDRASIQAATQMRRQAEGDYRPDPDADRFPEWLAPEPVPSRKPAAASWTLTGLVEDWWQESKAAGKKPATYESYRHTVKRLVGFLGHDDLGRVTADDVVAFKNHRLAEVNPRTGKPISAKTIKDSDLSGLKSVFGWAVENRRIAANPATGVKIRLGKKVKVRSKGFTDAEAQALLSAAWRLPRGSERPKTHAAKRWVPWLCAYTGARLGEMVQLRKKDLRHEHGQWVLWITPEAGTVKTNEARPVVLHPHLVELGFPAFVASSGEGHLFLTPAADGTVQGPWRGIKNRITEFARTVVTDPNVAPNHGWRHRFKTTGLEVGMSPRVLDDIQGHATGTVSGDYGDSTVKAMAMEIAKMPRYVLI